MPVTNPTPAALPVFNIVTGYGAKGDGTSDDSSAFNAAVAAASAAGGGMVYFPKGSYVLASANTALNNTTNVRLVGQGGGSSSATSAVTISCTAAIGSGAAAISANTATGLEIRNITFKVTNAGIATGTQVLSTSGTDVTIANCNFANASTNARYAVGLVLTPGAARVTVDHCTFSNFNWCVSGSSASGGHLVTFRECSFATYNYGILSPFESWTVSGCDFSDNGANGYAIALTAGTVQFLAQGNRIKYTGNSSPALVEVSSSQGASFIDNHIDSSGASVGGQTAINTGAATGLTLVNNYLNTNTGTALSLTGASGTALGTVFGPNNTSRMVNVGGGMMIGAQTAYNVRDFGAKGDSSTDDGVAITAAVAAASAAGGGTVYFPKGTYVLASSGYNWQNMTNVRLIGQSALSASSTPASILRFTLTGNFNLIIAYNSHGFEVSNLGFDMRGNNSGAGSTLFSFSSSTDLRFSNCSFTNTSATSVAGQMCDLSSVTRVVFDNCFFSNLNVAIAAPGANSVAVRDCNLGTCNTHISNVGSNWLIQNTTFGSTSATGQWISFPGGTTLYEVTILGCRFNNAGGCASGIWLPASNTLNGFVLQGNQFNAVSYTSGAINLQSSVNGLLAQGNVFTSSTAGTMGFNFGSLAHTGLVQANVFPGSNFNPRYGNTGALTSALTITDETTSTTAKNASVAVFTASGTWTKPTGATSVAVSCVGGGGGGGSGARNAAGTNRAPGGGGGGGGVSTMTMPASVLPASVSVTVGGGGTGGSGQGVDSTAGNAGTSGGNSTFGSYLRATGGTGGLGGVSTTTGTVAGGIGTAVGATGGAGAIGAIGGAGGDSNGGPGGGGAGGGINNAPVAAFPGGVGGGAQSLDNSHAAGGVVGGAVTGTTGAGAANSGLPGGGGGGGAATVGATGGTGGAGGLYGGGGGGGSGSDNGFVSGAGGVGGNGVVVVTSYF